MAKYDEYISAYFEQHSLLSMEKIGLLEKRTLASESQAGTPGGWTFTYDKKANTSEELIKMIADQTGKNKMLVAADLSSFFEQAREFINTGKAFEVAGAGFIKSAPGSIYQLVSYESLGEIIKKTKASATSIHGPEGKSKAGERVAGFVSFIIIGVILAALGYGIFQFFFVGDTGSSTITEMEGKTNADNTVSSEQSDQNSTASVALISPNDSVNFKFVIESTTNRSRAVSRTAQLKNFGNPANYDSVTDAANSKLYHIYIFKKATIGDTAGIRDSLFRFFIPKGSKKHIIIKQ